MKKFSQCLLCKYVFGRTCKLSNKYISDDIYNNNVKCEFFKSLSDEDCDIDDSCCSESKRYKDSINS